MDKLNRISEGFEFLSEEEITAERLSTLFNLAYLPAKIDEDNDIVVRDEYTVFINVSDRAKVLWYRIYLEEITDTPREIVESAIVNANSQVVFANLQLVENTLYSDMFLDYRNGLPAHTIVFSLRRLISVTNTLLSVLRESLDAYHRGNTDEGDS